MKSSLWSLGWKMIIVGALLASLPAMAQSSDDSEKKDEEEAIVVEMVVVGSRGKPRTVTDSTVPIDVISAKDFAALGNTADLTDNLKQLVPSYTATPATGDGSAFVRPTSLRGMAPDQTLVLVNGKRRHRSALVQFFAPAAGNGAHGVDVGMIPSIAVKRIEVLRDGAASQYGSDAIAGVMNFEMKDASSGYEVELQGGQHYEGENSYKIGFNGGFSVGDNGFINLSVERIDNDALSRGIQRADAQALIDSGVTGVGADAPFGDAPLVQTWGRPETSGTRIFINSGFTLGDTSRLYFHGGYGDTDGRYRFFYRTPNHPSLVPLRDQGFTGLPGGYTPYLDGAQKDMALVGGVEGLFPNDITYDFSVGIGMNELDYFLNNTINQDLGLVNGQPAQRDFDTGGYEQEELNFNADFSKPLTDKLSLGFGAEWREETYTAVAGEPNSYLGAGSNGLAGTSPRDAGEFSRDNIGVYADMEHEVNDDFLMQYALRWEDFSDFGSTLNWKLAGRYRVNPAFTLRGAVSTGFHAPTPGQANVRTTITTFDGVTGLQVEEGLVPPTSAAAIAAGGKALTEEESNNFSLGFTSNLNKRTTMTVDFYKIEVDGRIYRTGDIPVPGATSQTVSFYTNALDVESQGFDLVLTSGWDWSSDVRTNLTFALGFNEVDVVGQTQVGGITPVSDGIVEDIENNYPNERFVLTTNTRIGREWSFLARANYYGEHYDERGRIGAAVDPSAEIGATVYFDLELAYQVRSGIRIALGGVNVLDEFIEEIGPPNANRLSVGLQYPRRSAANYEGGSWYLKTNLRF